jgi:hypothetical protein
MSDAAEFVSLFDGRSLAGWHAEPRVYGRAYPGGPALSELQQQLGFPLPVAPEDHPAVWTVEEGAIVGRQDAPGSGYGGYLVTDEAYGDFELSLEARPDWPADTGIMIRRRPGDWAGFQVLLDHREHGGIGGFFGNGLGNFSATPFTVRARLDASGRPVGLCADAPVAAERSGRLSYGASVEDFLEVWRWGEWNEIRIRSVGELPVITTWINGLKIAELDAATLDAPDYVPADVRSHLGRRGHIALEVHDNDPISGLGRWGRDAACRWRNIRIRELGSSTG